MIKINLLKSRELRKPWRDKIPAKSLLTVAWVLAIFLFMILLGFVIGKLADKKPAVEPKRKIVYYPADKTFFNGGKDHGIPYFLLKNEKGNHELWVVEEDGPKYILEYQ